MENKEHSLARFEAEDNNEHTLSFRNFSVLDNIQASALHSPSTNPSAEDFFQFELQSPLPAGLIYTNPDTMFYNQEDDDDHLNEYQKRDYLTVLRSNSFSRPSPTQEASVTVSKDDLGSVRYSYSPKQSPASNPVHKVNITSLTSMSDKSRRRMFMFGPVKFEPEMELNAIKGRQARRRVPATIFPAPDGVMLVAGGRTGKTGRNSRRSKMMRSIRGPVHLAAVLARSVACIPLSIAAMAHKH